MNNENPEIKPVGATTPATSVPGASISFATTPATTAPAAAPSPTGTPAQTRYNPVTGKTVEQMYNDINKSM